jgi:RNA polymerase II subunit A-like phosphatase
VSLAPSDVPLVCAADDETLEVAVLQTCAHPVVWNRMCNSCGAEVDPAKQSGAHAHTASRKMSHLDGKYGEFNFHGTELRRLERQAQRRLLEVRKLSLVLDLDETVRCTAAPQYAPLVQS